MVKIKKISIILSLLFFFSFVFFLNINTKSLKLNVGELSVFAYDDTQSSSTQSVLSNIKFEDEKLEQYLLSISGQEQLDSNTFSDLEELIFDGNNALCSEILTINDLWQFNFIRLSTIQIVNMPKLVNIDISITSNTLATMIIQNNSELSNITIQVSSLKNLTLQQNPSITYLDISKSNNIRNLELDKMQFEEGDNLIERTLLYAPNLKTLFISKNEWLTRLDLSKSEKLENIVLDDCINLVKIDLSSELKFLTSLSFNNCYNLSGINIDSAQNLQYLSLQDCSSISVNFYNNLTNLYKLEYINLFNTKIRDINLNNFTKLRTLSVGSDYLRTFNLSNMESLYELNLYQSNDLKEIKLYNANLLSNFNIDNCTNLQSIILDNVGIGAFSVMGNMLLKNVYLDCNNLINITIDNCLNLNSLEFRNCVNLKSLEVFGCQNLTNEFVDNLSELNMLENVQISECDKIYTFQIKNKPYIKNLNIKNLNNLNVLSIENVGEEPNILLPTNLLKLRSLTLVDLSQANFNTSVLDVDGGVLSAVKLVNLPFTKINLNNNEIASFEIDKVNNLREIILSNNKISSIDSIITLLENSSMLTNININNNRIDFSKGDALEKLQGHKYRYCVVIGLQNIIEDNDYTYSPNIYFGGLQPHYNNIQVIVYHSSSKYSKASLTNSVLYNFESFDFLNNQFKKLNKGTYYITYQKLDSNGNIIEMTEEEKSMFSPIYFTVTIEKNLMDYVWIILVAFAGVIFIYVGIVYLIQKRQKAQFFGSEISNHIDRSSNMMTNKEMRKMQKENKKIIKQNKKLDKINQKQDNNLNKELKERELSANQNDISNTNSDNANNLKELKVDENNQKNDNNNKNSFKPPKLPKS